MNSSWLIIENSDAILGDDGAAFKNLYENSLSGHYTVSHLFVYRTAVMTFLADLCDFYQCVFSQFQTGAQRQRPKLDAFGSNIF